MPLDIDHHLAAVRFKPAAIQVLCHIPELNYEIGGQVFRLRLTAFFPPQLQQGCLVGAHNDPRVRAAEEMPAIAFQQRGFHVAHHTAYNHARAISTHMG